MYLEIFAEFSGPWFAAATVAGVVVSLSGLASKLLNQERKDEIALWLLGAGNQDSWTRGFCWMFDALFSEKHLSWKCLRRSIVASIFSILIVSVLFTFSGIDSRRFPSGFQGALLLAILTSFVVDYISLLQTRMFFQCLHHIKSWFVHLSLLILDLVLTVALILLAQIFTYNAGWLKEWMLIAWTVGIGEIVGGYSQYTIFFISALMTSVWSWAYLISTGILKFFTNIPGLCYWLDIENKPLVILGHFISAITFVVSFLVALIFFQNENGVARFDQWLCNTFGGKVCVLIARNVNHHDLRSELLFLGCTSPEFRSDRDSINDCLVNELRTGLMRDGEDYARTLGYSCDKGVIADCSYMCGQRLDQVICDRLQKLISDRD